MARRGNREPRFWTDARIVRLNRPGLHCIGDCLYVNVTPGGSRSWIYRYYHAGGRHDMGFGSVDLVSLDEARAAVLQARKLRATGGAPIEHRRRAQATARAELAKASLFDDVVEAFFAAQSRGWSPAYAKRWRANLATYASPILGRLPVNEIDVQLILRVLNAEAFWDTKPVLAKKVQLSIEQVFDYARAKGRRAVELNNPAKWQGHLDKLLPRPSKVSKVKHQKALPWRDIPQFVIALRGDDSVVSRALELITLTHARKNEALGAVWGEIDLALRVWTIPAERMKKSDREHRVALSAAAVELLDGMRRRCGGSALPHTLVFPTRDGRELNDDMPRKLLKKLGYVEAMTTHGLRSSFRDFVAEATSFPSEIAELALAHAVGSDTERAYRRSDMFERRLALADAWGNYCTGRPIDPTVLVDGKLPATTAAVGRASA
jgi:integrase